MKVFTPYEATQMLPLVRTIVADILDKGKELRKLQYEQTTSGEVNPLCEVIAQDVRHFVNELEELGCLYKDYDFTVGLVDFPSIIEDREVFLCWRSDETSLMYYHDIHAGYKGRKLIPDELLYDDNYKIELPHTSVISNNTSSD
jgi:hypothetical protein